jgi:flagellar biosynthesis/type III secretory pathway protein FliH
MTQRKFLFQEEFGAERGDPAKKIVQSELEVERQRAAAFAAGHEAALASVANDLAVATAAMAREVSALQVQLQERKHVLDRACIDLAMLIARKVVDVTLDEYAIKRVEAALLAALHDLPTGERVTLRVAPDLVVALEAIVENVGVNSDLRLHIAADSKIRPGDISMEWRDAAIRVESAQALDRLFELIERACAPSAHEGGHR